jgi:hypothetical protein
MHYSYTGGRRKTCFPFRSTQKCFTPTLGENTKNIPYRFPPNKCSKFLCYLSKVCCRKEAWAMQKLFIKRREREELKKWTSV